MLTNKFDPTGCLLCALRCEELSSVPPYLSLNVWINQPGIMGSASVCCNQSDIYVFLISWSITAYRREPPFPSSGTLGFLHGNAL